MDDEPIPRLIVLTGRQIGDRFELDQDAVIGRAAIAEVQIVDDDAISRRHATLQRRDGDWYIADTGSTGGTYVNSNMIRTVRLRDGDRITVGRTSLRFRTSSPDYSDEDFERLFLTDGLTGLATKRTLMATLEDAVAEGGPLGLIFVDIVSFKRFNDQHGHLAGDDVLRVLAKRLEAMAPESALVARYGGEEFAFVLQGSKAVADIGSLAARLRHAFVDDPLDVQQQAHPVSLWLHVGYATHDGSMSVREFVQAADQELFLQQKARRERKRHPRTPET